MLESEVQEIQEQTKLGIELFCSKITGKQPYLFEMKLSNNTNTNTDNSAGDGGKCFFLKQAGCCSIYNFRPMICRFYPFELKFDETLQKYVFTATTECPALNQKGKRLTQTDFKLLFWLAEKKLLQTT